MIKGLFETHLFVTDLERSVDFYKNTLGLKQCYHEEERRASFFWIGNERQSFLGLWEQPEEAVDLRHFAFETTPEFVINDAIDFLKDKKLNYWNFLRDDTDRPMVFSWIPAVSIYFSDPDGHALEFIGKLEGRARPELGVLSYEDWTAIVDD